MKDPDERLFEADLKTPAYLSGAGKGCWGLAGPDVVPEKIVWPKIVVWWAVPPRPKAPDRFYALLEAKGYRAASPTGTFWNPETKERLDNAKRPKGRAGSRFAKVFRTDYKNGDCFYHPYDRVSAADHRDWPKELPHLIWDEHHTIADYLSEFHTLLQSGDYLGIE